jgi:bis(5'-nucleosyl)-tetraphosphatase (symmetrical)
VATYVVGDVQGCYASLQALLAKVRFAPERDRLWLTGDLVNRGPASLAVLRFVRGLGDRAVTVLGNHDLHLLARAQGRVGPKARDTLDEVLGAPDLAELVQWLATRPLLHEVEGKVLVHAGLKPEWTVAAAAKEARRLERDLALPKTRATALPDPALKILTTLRACHLDGTPCKFSGPPAEAPPGCIPWYQHPARRSLGTMVYFGHWAAGGVVRGKDYTGLDSGCVWGRELSALRIEDGRLYAVAALEPPAED